MSTTSAAGILACSIVLPVLGTVAVGLRFYVRSNQKVQLQFDDWAQIPALVLFVAMAITALIGVANFALGYPSPVADPNPSTILGEKLWFVIQLIQIPALSLIKIAALRFYRRIFCIDRSGLLYYLIWIQIGLITSWGIGFTVFYIASCGNHPEAAWAGVKGFLAYCRNTETFEESYAISDMLLDTFVLITPLPSIWRLQTSIGRKLGITGVFLLALIGYAASIARLAVFIKLTESTLATAPPDVQTQDTQATWFSMLELGLAIIALNLPSLWPLIANMTVESLVRSVRSVFSLHSRSSHSDPDGDDSEHGTRNNRSAVELQHQDHPDPKISLVPYQEHVGVDSTITGSEATDDRRDLEDGISVKKTIDQQGRSIQSW